MSSPFPKKTVYHSALVKEGPIDVVMTSNEPQASKFQGKNDFISFKIDGEEHYLEMENDDCAQAVTGWQGQTVTLTASGSRGDARIAVEPVDGGQQRSPARQERQQQRQPARQQQERPPVRHSEPSGRGEQQPTRRETPEERAEKELRAFKKAAVFGAKCSVLMRMAFRYADTILSDAEASGITDPTTEDVRALATTLFIEMKSQTDIHALPSKWIDLKAEKKPAPAQQQPPQRQPDPEPEPQRQPEPQQPAWRPGDNDDAAEDDIPF